MTAPRIIEEHGFRVEDEGDVRFVSLPYIRRRTPGSIAAGVTLLSVLATALTYMLVDRAGALDVARWPGIVTLVLLYVTCVLSINRVRIRADARGFVVAVVPFPVRLTRRFPLARYRGPYVAERPVKRKGEPAIRYDLRMMDAMGKPYSMFRGFDDEAAARYAARVLQRESAGTAEGSP